MSTILPFVVTGIATGSILGLAATGLVLTYKTSGIFNFGHGALATAAAYLFYWLHIDREVNWIVAGIIAVCLLGPILGLVMELISRRLARQRASWQIVGTVGLILVVQGLGTVKYGPDRLAVPQYLPKGLDTFELAGINVQYGRLTVALISAVAVGGLYALFRFSRIGIAMRAVVDDPDLLDLTGTSPSRIRRISWITGSMLAALSGVLILPFLGLEPIALTLLVVQTFGAAAVGRFSSIPLTFLGGLLLGVGADILTKYQIDYPALNGLSSGLPFIVLIIVMLVIPKRHLLPPSAAVVRPPLQWQGPASLRIAAHAVVFALLATVPFWVDSIRIFSWIRALTVMIIVLSLGLLVRTAGIVSLCTATFAAIGAVATSQFIVDAGLPFVVAVLLGGLVAVPVGALVAVPSIRLTGLFLALSTLGFGILVERVFYSQSFMFTSLATGRRLPRPDWAKSDDRYYWLVLGFVALTVTLIGAVHRGRLGRILAGTAESPTAVSTLGLSINVTRVIVFCIGAFIAAVAGGLYGGTFEVFTAENPIFISFFSIVLVAILALAPFRVPWYAIFAGLTQIIPAYIESPSTKHWLNAVFGFFAVVVALQGGPHGMPTKLQHFFESRFGRSKVTSQVIQGTDAALDTRRPRPQLPAGAVSGLAVEALTVRFGGLVAVDSATLEAPMGRITGLIGPNGAGKTTTFNACSGLNRPSSGRVLFNGRSISTASPASRARHGLGRTFQIMELCESLTVADNVALGCEAGQAGANPVTQILAPRSELQHRNAATKEAIELCGLDDVADIQAGALSTGQRRLVELARCLAGPFDVLLLDEPSSGLDHEETARFGAVLRQVVQERGSGILLVEHDMSLVMDVCEHIYVLDFGRMIFDGAPAEVADSPVVQAAYLGSEAVAPPEADRAPRAQPEEVVS